MDVETYKSFGLDQPFYDKPRGAVRHHPCQQTAPPPPATLAGT